jgi:MFS family permease
MMRLRWSVAPEGATPIQKQNFRNVQIDAVGVGIAAAAAPFLPVFLTRLGASNFQVGLLTAMPAFTGLFFSILVGRFLARRQNIVPWYSTARLLTFSCYALTGLASMLFAPQHTIAAVLLIWMFATAPQTVVAVAFSVVMNAVAGPDGRYALMSRRWSIIGLTIALTVTLAGQVLDRLSFPLNYQAVFIGLALGALISFYFSIHLRLPTVEPPAHIPGLSRAQRLKGYIQLVRNERPFVSFTAKRFVYLAGTTLGLPLFPLYFVYDVHATEAWIGVINSTQMAVTLVGYLFWARQGRRRGSRFVLLWTTLGVALYPALVASTRDVHWIVLCAGLAGMFQAGLDLVFFDELMKTVPVQHSAIFVGLAQSLQHLAAVIAPLIGTALTTHIGIGGALLVSAAIRLVGFGLFAWKRTTRR